MDRQYLFKRVKDIYATDPDYPWNDWNAVLRHKKNNKWYGLIMEIPANRLGLQGDRLIDILNVKCDFTLIDLFRSKPGYFLACHINKENWISIALDGSVPANEIKSLISMSYDLTAG